MLKIRLNLRKEIAIAIYLAGMVMFWGCDTDDEYLQKSEVVINGVTWATRNVDMPGTFAAHPESTGMFYQWGKNVGWSTTNPVIASNGSTTWDNISYKGNVWTKENCPCPKGWRVPTEQELQKLVDAGSNWTTINGVKGRKFGSGSNSIFLPAVGERGGSFDDGLRKVGECGNYWSSTFFSLSSLDFTSYLYFSKKKVYEPIGWYGMVSPTAVSLSVRCVKE